jgi:hypothetical protein
LTRKNQKAQRIRAIMRMMGPNYYGMAPTGH